MKGKNNLFNVVTKKNEFVQIRGSICNAFNLYISLFISLEQCKVML